MRKSVFFRRVKAPCGVEAGVEVGAFHINTVALRQKCLIRRDERPFRMRRRRVGAFFLNERGRPPPAAPLYPPLLPCKIWGPRFDRSAVSDE